MRKAVEMILRLKEKSKELSAKYVVPQTITGLKISGNSNAKIAHSEQVSGAGRLWRIAIFLCGCGICVWLL
jgi:hypothetical protein